MKYYIPTSSLNLDNILQAECISPQSFYAQRKTGYESIELIDEVKKYNQIVLFNHPVSFSINDPGRYNYPLLIEIEDDIQLRNIHNIEGSGMYLCSYTIYLTPQNCAFYFFAENAYRLTTINTKDNRSVKYYDKYNISPSTSRLKLIPLKIETITGEPVHQNNETIIDKQKGICYAFLMGQLHSITPELARQQRLSQELYNYLTGIISNPKMKDHLLNNLESLLKEYKSVDPIELRSQEKFENKLNEELGRFLFLKSCLIDILKKWEVWDYVFQRLYHKWECELLPNITELISNQNFVELRNEIDDHTNDTLKEYRKKQPLPSLSSISINKDVVEIKDMPIISQTINYIIKNQLTADCLSAERRDICEKLIKNVVIEEIKKVKGERYWDSSLEQKYFNALYYHIGDLGKPFNLKEIDNPELMAVAAFLLRGHDINALMAYLKSNEICDYRYILVLWGALCGYMEMNKEFLSDILTLDNYKNVYECIFHHPMRELKHDSNEESLKKDNDKISQTKTVDEINDNVILTFINTLISKCKGAEKDKYIYENLFKEYGMSYELLQAIKIDKNLNKGKGAQKTVTVWIEKQIALKSKKRKKQSNQKSPFKETQIQDSEYSFSYTQNPDNMMEKLSCLEGVSKDVLNRMKDNWDYVLSQKDNKIDIINYFINLCKKEGDGRAKKRTVLFGFFTDEIAIECKKELEEKYDR